MTPADDGFTLSTGREVYANCGILGLERDDDDGRLRLAYGYDGHVLEDQPDYREGRPMPCKDAFTPEERAEIAEYVIALWREWAQQS